MACCATSLSCWLILRCAVSSLMAVRPVGGGLREGLVQAGEAGDDAVNAGDRENAEDGSGGDDQQQFAAFSLGALVRREQGMQPGGVTELGPGHVDHERAVPVRGRCAQSRPQRAETLAVRSKGGDGFRTPLGEASLCRLSSREPSSDSLWV